MDTNSWIYNKHKILFELQSMFHPCINQKPRYWLPPYKKEKKIVRTQYINVYITCLSKFVQNYPYQLYSIDKLFLMNNKKIH
jgi:hypothetical protein